MSDDHLEPGFGEFFDPENPPRELDPEDAKCYLLSREIWTIRIERDQRPLSEQQDDFMRQFAEVFQAHFSANDVHEPPEHKVFFWPDPREELNILFAHILVRNITDANRAATRALFNQQKKEPVAGQFVSGETETLCRSLQPASWGGGGPGGLPFPQLTDVIGSELNPDPPAPYSFVLPRRPANVLSDLPEKLSDLQTNPGYGGKNVQIAILDTAPQPAIWQQAVNNFPNHPIIKSLAGVIDIRAEKKFPLLTLEDEQDIADELAAKGFTSYPLVEHGLFVAGIIHSIAPNASIKLYRVLDDNGVGLRFVVECGLMYAESEAKNKPLIINCSLTMVLPQADKYRNEFGEVEEDWASIGKNITIVGAAGNEGLYKTRPNGSKPPYPRYPAGFTKALGVTALNKDSKRASYANWAEDYDIDDLTALPGQAPAPGYYPYGVGENHSDRVGIATLGGEVMSFSHLRVTNPFDSILGLYISDNGLPGLAYSILGQHNGWARWSGTSFANAIASGVLALIASYRFAKNQSTNQKSLVKDLLEYCDARLTQDGNNYEHVLNVTQGT